MFSFNQLVTVNKEGDFYYQSNGNILSGHEVHLGVEGNTQVHMEYEVVFQIGGAYKVVKYKESELSAAQ